MTSIGSLTASVEARAGSFTKTMNKAADSVSNFRASAVKDSDRVGRAINDNTKSARRDLNSFERRAKQTGRVATNSFNAVRTAAGALVPALGVAAAVEFTRRTVEATDELAKQAKTVDLSVERLQTLGFAFERLGVQQSTFIQGSGDFIRRLGQARTEAGSLRNTFEGLGVNIRGTTEDAFQSAIESLAEIEDSAARAAKAGKIFGEEAGFKLAGALGAGKVAVADLEREARALGIVSNEAAANAERLADEFTNISQKVGARLTNTILENKDAILALAEAASDAVDKIGKMATKLALLTGQLEETEADSRLRAINTELLILQKTLDRAENKNPSFFDLKPSERRIEQYKDSISELRKERDKLLRGKEAADIISNFAASGAVPESAAKSFTPTITPANDNKVAGQAGPIRGTSGIAFEAEENFRKASEAAARYRDLVSELQSPITPVQQVIADAEARQLVIDNALENRIISEAEAAQRYKEVWGEAEEEIKNLRLQGLQEQFAMTTDTFRDTSDALKAFLGENNKAYRLAFSAYKAFATGEAIVAGYLAVQKAAANLPFPANLPGIIQETARAAANVAAIKGQGFRSGGYTGDGGPTDIAGVVHGREFVMNEAATRANRPTLEAMNKGVSVNGIGRPANQDDIRVSTDVRVEVVPSDMFDVRVTEKVRKETAPIQRDVQTLNGNQKMQGRALDDVMRRSA